MKESKIYLLCRHMDNNNRYNLYTINIEAAVATKVKSDTNNMIGRTQSLLDPHLTYNNRWTYDILTEDEVILEFI